MRNQRRTTPAKNEPVVKEEKKPDEIVITKEIEPEEIEPLKKDIALIGKSVECRDFRAICKKRDLQINKVLPEILQKWNTENYCL